MNFEDADAIVCSEHIPQLRCCVRPCKTVVGGCRSVAIRLRMLLAVARELLERSGYFPISAILLI